VRRYGAGSEGGILAPPPEGSGGVLERPFVDDQIRAFEEYVYAKYIDPSAYTPIDEEAAVAALDAYYRRPEAEQDPDCFFPGVLYFELGFEIEAKKVEYFRKAKYWLERHKALSADEAWDVVDDRLADLQAYFEEEGIQTEATPAPPAAPAVAPAPVVQEIEDHGTMVLVPSGGFLFGSESRPVSLAAFYIDKYPVTNRQYGAFCRATGYRWPKYWEDERFNHADGPVVGVSVADAVKFSRWVGKELPTEEQWEKATRGTDGRLYPWGSDPPTPERACHGRDPETGRTDPVTAHPGSASPYGAHEMAGNVWEWTSTTVEDGEVLNVVKGGCFNDPPDLLRAFVRLEAMPKDKFETIGFRCVKSA
jgi:formylglycine-generating enzyme required for sulfatase activity